MKKLRRIIGILFLIPPVLGVFSFTLGLCGCKMDIATLNTLSSKWTYAFSAYKKDTVFVEGTNNNFAGGATSSARS